MNKNITIGMDLGGQSHVIVVLDKDGAQIECRTVKNTKISLKRYFQTYAGASVAIEAGTHSPWISRLLEQLGCTDACHGLSTGAEAAVAGCSPRYESP